MTTPLKYKWGSNLSSVIETDYFYYLGATSETDHVFMFFDDSGASNVWNVAHFSVTDSEASLVSTAHVTDYDALIEVSIVKQPDAVFGMTGVCVTKYFYDGPWISSELVLVETSPSLSVSTYSLSEPVYNRFACFTADGAEVAWQDSGQEGEATIRGLSTTDGTQQWTLTGFNGSLCASAEAGIVVTNDSDTFYLYSSAGLIDSQFMGTEWTPMAYGTSRVVIAAFPNEWISSDYVVEIESLAVTSTTISASGSPLTVDEGLTVSPATNNSTYTFMRSNNNGLIVFANQVFERDTVVVVDLSTSTSAAYTSAGGSKGYYSVGFYFGSHLFTASGSRDWSDFGPYYIQDGVVYYWGTFGAFPLRMAQRDDGRGTTENHPRIATAGFATKSSSLSGRLWNGQTGSYK